MRACRESSFKWTAVIRLCSDSLSAGGRDMTSGTAGKFNSVFCSPKSSDVNSKVFVFAVKLKS